MQFRSVFIALSMMILNLMAYDPAPPGLQSSIQQITPCATATPSATAQSSFCRTLSCGLLESKFIFVPEDSNHCAIECCSDSSGCTESFIPWVNKTNGKTDKWYHLIMHKMVDTP